MAVGRSILPSPEVVRGDAEVAALAVAARRTLQSRATYAALAAGEKKQQQQQSGAQVGRGTVQHLHKARM